MRTDINNLSSTIKLPESDWIIVEKKGRKNEFMNNIISYNNNNTTFKGKKEKKRKERKENTNKNKTNTTTTTTTSDSSDRNLMGKNSLDPG